MPDKTKIVRRCLVCNKEFTPDRANLNRGNGNCCSKSCETKRRWTEPVYRNRMKELRRDEAFLISVGKGKGWSTAIGNKRLCRFCNIDMKCKPRCENEGHKRYYETVKRTALEYHYDNREKILSKNDEIVTDVINHYGAKCACCGYNNMNKKINQNGHFRRFLQIDIINGGGAKFHRQVHNLHHWLKRNNYPAGYRVLCGACNPAMETGDSICELHKWLISMEVVK